MSVKRTVLLTEFECVFFNNARKENDCTFLGIFLVHFLNLFISLKVLHSIDQWWKCNTSVCSICKKSCFESVQFFFIRKFIEILNLYRKRWLFGHNPNFVSNHGQSNHWSHKIHTICNILFGDSIPVAPWRSLCQYRNSKKKIA